MVQMSHIWVPLYTTKGGNISPVALPQIIIEVLDLEKFHNFSGYLVSRRLILSSSKGHLLNLSRPDSKYFWAVHLKTPGRFLMLRFWGFLVVKTTLYTGCL